MNNPYPTEVWRDVVGYEGYYRISSHGRVMRIMPFRSTYAGRILKPFTNSRYYCVDLTRGNEGKQRHPVHRLVMFAFVGERPTPDTHINHIDGDKLNNHIENLEYTTAKENIQHALKMGLRHAPAGESHYSTRLTQEQVIQIRVTYAAGGITYDRLGERFGLTRSAIYAIVKGRTWKHVTPDDTPPARTQERSAR